MAIVMAVRHDAAADPSLLTDSAVLAGGLGSATAFLYRPMLNYQAIGGPRRTSAACSVLVRPIRGQK